MRQKKEPGLTRLQRVGAALLVSNLLSAVLFLVRVAESGNIRYWFLLWNLVLAWTPLALILLLRERLTKSSWLTWQNIVLSFLWLGFLPNSFYLVSDLIHLHSTGEVTILYDAVMFMSFIFNGFVAGFASLYVLHTLLLRRFRSDYVHGFIAGVLLLCSFAIYLGRELRWNTWDILVNPAGILFDVSERVINPVTHSEMFGTTLIFFLLLASVYLVAWQFVAALRNSDS